MVWFVGKCEWDPRGRHFIVIGDVQWKVTEFTIQCPIHDKQVVLTSHNQPKVENDKIILDTK